MHKKTKLAIAGIAFLMLTLVILVAFARSETPSSSPAASGEILSASVGQASVVMASFRSGTVQQTASNQTPSPTRTQTPTSMPRFDVSKMPVLVEFWDIVNVSNGQFQDRLAVTGRKNIFEANNCGGPGLVTYDTTVNTKSATTPAPGDNHEYAGYARLNRSTCTMEIIYIYPSMMKGDKYYTTRIGTVLDFDLDEQRIAVNVPDASYQITDQTVYITYDGKPIKAGDTILFGQTMKNEDVNGRTVSHFEILWILRNDYAAQVMKAAGLK